MDENTGKRIIAYTSQSLRQYGIRSVRMDTIAKDMKMSKRTIYQVYESKDNLINTCLASYSDRTGNLFQILRFGSPDSLAYLWEIAKAYAENLYKAKCVFWLELDRHYQYISVAIQRIWQKELGGAIHVCQQEGYIMADLNAETFLEAFTKLLYNARVTKCAPGILYSSTFFMLKGIMTMEGINRLEPVKNDLARLAEKPFKTGS